MQILKTFRILTYTLLQAIYACSVFLMTVFMCFLGRSYDWVLEEDSTAVPIHDASGDDRLLIGAIFLAAALICQFIAAFLIRRKGKHIAALLSGGAIVIYLITMVL
ncbi:hypothetical protein [Zymobacter sp. IVIA_12111.31 C1]|uniref:hypothetical protein n=1 Tax=Zymobacter sp. IVIA_12111.31 C1 TaxID=3394854 RepID=UPI0039C2A055